MKKRLLFLPLLVFLLLGNANAAQSTPVVPTEGIWWSSENPGTGVAFNVDAEGRWFAAIYLYDQDGKPTFLTMQGDSIEYVLPHDNVHESPQPYARVASALIRSEGGQCLGCPWTQATASPSGDGEAVINFYGRNRAEFSVGDWSMRIAPLLDAVNYHPDIPEQWVEEYFDATSEFYAVTIDTDAMKTVVVGRLISDSNDYGVPTPWRDYIFECVDCRTTFGEEPSTEEQETLIGGPYYLQSFRFRCDHSGNRTNCQPRRRITDAKFILQSFFIDQTGQEIILLDQGDGEERLPGRIELRALPADWQSISP